MRKSTKLATAAVALMGVLSAGSLLLAAGLPAAATETALISAIREQVDLLKWVGGAMVSGLVVAVGWLWSALGKEQAEAKVMYRKSAEADDRLAQAVEKLTDHLQQRPCLLNKDK
jgi:hypothetical protein